MSGARFARRHDPSSPGRRGGHHIRPTGGANRSPQHDLLGDGAAALVLQRLSDVTSGQRVYAVIEDTGEPDSDKVDAEADVGFTGAASGLASLVKAALCLHHEIRVTGATPSYWVHDSTRGPRRIGVQQTSVTGTTLGVTLRAACVSSVARPLGDHTEALFVAPTSTLPRRC